MRHATRDDLETLGVLLEALRGLPTLKERKPGVFYRKSKAFLHFHEDGGQLFADVRLDGKDFDRLPVTARSAQRKLLAAIRAIIQPG